MSVTKEIYKPSLNVGQVYARPYGSKAAFMPIGNVLELSMEHKEDVKTQPDMTRLGGGTHAEVRRVTEVTLTTKIADLNITNLARAVLGTVEDVVGGSVTAEAASVGLGGLLRLAHIGPTAVVVRKGATTVAAPGNYEVRPEGIYVLPDATDLAAADAVLVDYTYGAYAAIQALTTKTIELEMSFGGLNEADSGKPVVVDVYRVSQGVTKQLQLLSDKFAVLEVSGAVLMDPSKTGAGISRYYKTSMV